MSWSRALSRRAALLGLAAAAGCGFAPVYGPGGTADGLRHAISVEAPATDVGFRLRQRMFDRLGRPETPTHHLSVDIEIARAPVAVTETQETTRYNLPGTAAFRLVALATETVVLTDEVSTFTSFSATGTALSTLAAERDARERLATLLADLIVTRLMIAAPDLTR